MLIDFQQALAEITASPRLCLAIRQDPTELDRRYGLTPKERRQLVAAANHPGMECSCSIYRMNRLAPLVRNLRATLYALEASMERALVAYWDEHPWIYSNGYLECDRFCRWLRPNLHRYGEAEAPLASILAADEEQLRLLLESSLSQPRYGAT